MSTLLSHRMATLADCDSLVNLINIAYKNEPGHQGWTNENELVSSARTDANDLQQLITANESVILIFFHPTNQTLVGCVLLQLKPEIQSAYLGMLCVHPDLQAKGYGKMILSVGEQYAASEWNVHYIQLTTIIQRKELVDFYQRRGYIDTGKRLPFPSNEFVRPARDDLVFCVMRKCLKTSNETLLT